MTTNTVEPSFEEQRTKARSFIAQRLQQMEKEPIKDIRSAQLAAIEDQAELCSALGLFRLSESDSLVVHARDVCDGRESTKVQPGPAGRWY